jgi:putative ABC transport system permease protein
MTENLMLASVAGAFGICAAWGLTRVIVAVAPTDVPRLASSATGFGPLGFAVAVTVVSGLLFGLMPAVRSTRGAVTDGLARFSRGAVSDRRTLRPQQLLVVFQVSVSVALLAGAALLVRSYGRLMSVEPGYTTEHVTLAAISPPEDRYSEPEPIDAFYAELLDRVRALPGVVAATTTYTPPLSGNGFSMAIEVEGQPYDEYDRPWAGAVVVRENYFETTGTPLLRGRDFDDGDRLGGEPVVIVNETMVERFWPGEDAIGKRFRMTSGLTGSMGQFDRRFFPPDWFTVVGVAGDIRRSRLDEPPGPEYYRPHRQVTWSFQYLVVRTAVDMPGIAPQIRDLVRSIDSTVPVGEVRTARATIREATAAWRFRMHLISAFAIATCLLAMLGVYAVMALAVARRRREIGVRMALGATRGGLQRQVLRRGLGLVSVGAVVGLAASLAAGRVIESMLFEVGTTDAPTYAVVTAITATVSVLACWLPARRASRIDPVRSLSQD